jgi:peptide/nickel transport system ATP-binding protein
MSDLLKISGIGVEYRSRNSIIRAIDGVSLEIPSTGYTLGLVGESGSGKSTLGMSIMNLIEPPGKIVSGSVEYMGKNILSMNKQELLKYRWEKVSMIYQSAMNSLNPVKQISDPIVEVLIEHKHMSKSEARDLTVKLLNEVGIKPSRFPDFPHELSGGMRQRVVIALALALSPNLLIADEPTSALDVVIQKQILTLIKREISQKNLSLIFITHEIALLGGLVNDVAVMFAGEIVERGPIEKVVFEPLHPYTEMLIGTILTKAIATHKLNQTSEKKEIDEIIPLNSCRYSRRCKYAFDRCQRERPLLQHAGNGRWVACHKYS